MTRAMSTSRKARIFEQHGGVCHLCGQKIDGTRERWDAEHIVPYALTRDDSDENLAPAHVDCHKAKTRQDVTAIAKAKRVAAKHNGAFQTRSKLPGGRSSKFKRKINGTTVSRDEDA